MHKEVNLIARAQQEPILVDEVGEERLPVPDVQDGLEGGNVDEIRIEVGVVLRGLLALLLGLLLFRLRTLGQQSLPLRRVLPLVLQLPPLLEALLPLRPSLLEGVTGLQILNALRHLPCEDPILQRFAGLRFGAPVAHHLVEALLLRGQREVCVGLREDDVRKIREAHLAEAQGLLLLCELDFGLVFLGLGLVLLLLILPLLLLDLLLLGLIAVLFLLCCSACLLGLLSLFRK
mmetsp:Transcript_65261/g.164496  ORF Transcript_65261/g.164496 Transcript_65261/m.164496 type:complete len:233 (+) Transcript_65261:617-1315(+)